MLTLLIIHKRNISSVGCHGISDGANLLYTCEDRNTTELIEAVRQICSLIHTASTQLTTNVQKSLSQTLADS